MRFECETQACLRSACWECKSEKSNSIHHFCEFHLGRFLPEYLVWEVRHFVMNKYYTAILNENE